MHYIEQRIREGEHQQQDFKFRVDDARKIAKTLVAFANTDGGRLLIGVKDNGKITGVRSQEEFHVIEAASQLYTHPEVGFIATIHDVNGKQVLEIDVPASENRPHYAIDEHKKQWAFFRLHDQNHPANGVLLRYWQLEKPDSKQATLKKYGQAHRELLRLVDSDQRVSISKFIKIAGVEPREATDILATFLKWNLIAYQVDSKGIHFTATADE